MLKFIEEFRRYVAITGFRNVEIKDIDGFLRSIGREKLADEEIQFFNAELVATWQHLYFAVLNALTAFRNGENISKSLAVEAILYASAQHQIRKATEMLGIKPNLTSVATLIIGDKPETVRSALSRIMKQLKTGQDETVLELTKEKVAKIQRLFGISDEEVKTVIKKNDVKKAVVDLVVERMALLATER